MILSVAADWTAKNAMPESQRSRTIMPCVFLAPERTFYEFFEIDFLGKRAMDRI